MVSGHYRYEKCSDPCAGMTCSKTKVYIYTFRTCDNIDITGNPTLLSETIFFILDILTEAYSISDHTISFVN